MDSCKRLLSPRSVVLVGGASAERVCFGLQNFGYGGDIFIVNRNRSSMCGLRCYGSLSELPYVPDCAFLGVNSEATIEAVAYLRDLGCGGAVCMASGFAELGSDGGMDLAERLRISAGDMPYLGPNCYGYLNYFDGVGLWPDVHGGMVEGGMVKGGMVKGGMVEGGRHERGIAIISQSGNLALNMTFSRRGLRLGYVLSLGNGDNIDLVRAIELMLADGRVSAIGIYSEGISDIGVMGEVCLRALRESVPIVLLAGGRSQEAQSVVRSHTASLSGSADMCEALYRKLGVSVCYGLGEFLEQLKAFDILGGVGSCEITSSSCSGGEAALLADSAERIGLSFKALTLVQERALREVLSPHVCIGNPLDYHTFIWGDYDCLLRVFSAMVGDGDFAGVNCLVLDFPPDGVGDIGAWDGVVRAWRDAVVGSGVRGCLVSAIFESLPESVMADLVGVGIYVGCGFDETLMALRGCYDWQVKRGQAADLRVIRGRDLGGGGGIIYDEYDGKNFLRDKSGLRIPRGFRVTSEADLEQALVGINYPCVLKVCDKDILHKSDIGGVALGLGDSSAVLRAYDEIKLLGAGVLLEEMVLGVVGELFIGFSNSVRDGVALILASGGIWVESLGDRRILPVPVSEGDIRLALESLLIYPLLSGSRGQVGVDKECLVRDLLCLVGCVNDGSDIIDMDINPLFVCVDGVVIGDAYVRVMD